MKDYFTLDVPEGRLNGMNVLALAHIGDAVFEVLCRGWLCSRGPETIGNLHRAAVAMVRADAQAAAMERLLPHLTEAEAAVFRRGRNANVHQIPKNATRRDYAYATGLEALFGWLYLQGRRGRINELFAVVVDESGEG